jgi:hypothetical protein
MEDDTIHQNHNPIEIKGPSSFNSGEGEEAQENVQF